MTGRRTPPWTCPTSNVKCWRRAGSGGSCLSLRFDLDSVADVFVVLKWLSENGLSLDVCGLVTPRSASRTAVVLAGTGPPRSACRSGAQARALPVDQRRKPAGGGGFLTLRLRLNLPQPGVSIIRAAPSNTPVSLLKRPSAHTGRDRLPMKRQEA
jgi:hypothetical protein